jgi:hypothetical protein
MELSNNNQPKLKTVTIKLNEATYNKLLLLKQEDGITPAIRIANIIKAQAQRDTISSYQG